ncbi:MAG TPA: hypothetical protein ENF33_00295 [Nitrososphaeria archaeon]|nr:MAG: hypothetical protein DRN68_00410 [Nitrososphaerota archaeon]HDJ66142.1 hypothetical protein [Nitrososphaeria archaeon]
MPIQIISNLISQFVAMAPRIIGAIIILIIGWAVGRGLGAVISRLLDKAGVDDALRKTSVGKAIEKAGITLPRFFDILVRIFIYLVAVFAAVNVLQIDVLTYYMKMIVEYLPSLIAGIVILIFGLMIADFIGDAITAVGREAKIEYASLASMAVRGVLYLVVIIIGLSTMKIDVSILNMVVTALSWGVAGAIAIGGGLAIGLGLKDYVTKKAEEWLKKASESAKALEKK